MSVKNMSGRKQRPGKGGRPMPISDFKRPETDAEDSGSLMALQDTEHKGDGHAAAKATREERVLVGFKMPVSLKQQLKIKSAQTGKTMAELLTEGAEMRLAVKDPS